MKVSPVTLHSPGVICTLGQGEKEVREALFCGHYPASMRRTDTWSPGKTLTLGSVDVVLPPLPDKTPKAQRSRNNQMLLAAYLQIEATIRQALAGIPRQRVAVVLGTSTTGVSESETAIRELQASGKVPESFHYSQQELGSPARFIAEMLGLGGPAYAISTACTSSAKALISGARLLAADCCDVALVGGVDTLTRFTVAGFSALGAVSADHCLPFSANRCGINIGEGAALFVMTREPGAVQLAGWGESSDAYHISAPDPQGQGARLAITAALRRANCSASEIDYINLHGTATRHNDAMEGTVMNDLFPTTPMSSTKPLTGHTLGAAGAIEAVVAWLTLSDAARRLPPHISDAHIDPAFAALKFVAPGECALQPPRHVLSTSFAFGGNNAALILKNHE